MQTAVASVKIRRKSAQGLLPRLPGVNSRSFSETKKEERPGRPPKALGVNGRSFSETLRRRSGQGRPSNANHWTAIVIVKQRRKSGQVILQRLPGVISRS